MLHFVRFLNRATRGRNLMHEPSCALRISFEIRKTVQRHHNVRKTIKVHAFVTRCGIYERPLIAL